MDSMGTELQVANSPRHNDRGKGGGEVKTTEELADTLGCYDYKVMQKLEPPKELSREQLLNEMHELAKVWLVMASHPERDEESAHLLKCCAADLDMLREAWLILIVKENTLPPAR